MALSFEFLVNLFIWYFFDHFGRNLKFSKNIGPKMNLPNHKLI
jgi:hypothetical protein